MTLKSASAITFIIGIFLVITGWVRSWGSETDVAFYIGGVLFIVIGEMAELINERLKEIEKELNSRYY
ncbi:hypothetical protein [Jeotgalibacillus salarius]|uniref:Uncharacterized protein n=1 Tax=Jeotgalibacillus salarius TaxID=546023 RepID=A0A4Y8LBE0_9BACL|nr:hypothetical protein [Jeotgalibacillus salarius]TFD99484.1 hypothetical protein E2626_14590 [Jeotgalibacillus salarius]